MNIESTSKNTIVISLSSQDLDELGITYEDMDYKNLDTRRVIYTLLQEASEELDRDLHPSGKMLIEAVPDPFGGCVLYFTVYQSDADKDEFISSSQSAQYTFMCEFGTENDLIDASRVIVNTFIATPKSKLYTDGNDYRIIFNCVSKHKKLKAIMSEYCKGLTESSSKIAHTKEHWNCLCDKDAIKKLGVS